MAEIPAEAANTTDDLWDLLEMLKDVRIRFWACLNPDHKAATWTGDVARCDTCGLTSEMTSARYAKVREAERVRIAAHLRAIPDDDQGFHTGVRRFIDRHTRLVDGTSIVAVLLAAADEIEGTVFAAPALSGTLHPPQSPESVSAPPATHRHADAPPNPSSTRTSPHMSGTGHTRNPRNEEA